MGGAPLVTAIVPVKNGARFLAGALDSIAAQTHVPMETVVVDGHSTDDTVRIAEGRPGVRVVMQESGGIAEAFNQGVGEARGEFLGFLGHDDRWEPDKIEKQLRFIEAHAELRAAFTKFRFVLREGCELPPDFRPELLDRDLDGPLTETLLAHRSLFEEVGSYRSSFNIAFDVDWLSRARDLGVQIGVVPEVLMHKGVHEANASNDAETNTALLLQILRESIGRKQGGSDTEAR